MVGEGVLFECLQNPLVSEVLIVNRRHYDLSHPKLKELLVSDFFHLDKYREQIQGYDACYFCAGVTSLGKNEQEYHYLTYDTTLAFAKSMVSANPNIVFTYVSGASTDSTEKGRLMWARVKGKTENDLNKLGFKAEYNFRPGVMLPFPGQKNWKDFVVWIVKAIRFFVPKKVLTLEEVGKAMIYATTKGYPKAVLEVEDIKKLAQG